MAERKVAVVTGAARGIGAAVATRLGADGFAVAVWDLDADGCDKMVADLVEKGVPAYAVVADVSDEAAVVAGVEQIAQRLGPPVALVNNAGVLRDNLLFKMSSADWDTVLGVHVRGAFLMSRAVQAHMVQQRWGRIVSLSSTSAYGNRGQANYSAAKAALQGLTKTLAVELGPFGITANAVAPGFVQTEMTAATARRIGRPFDELIAEAAAGIPVRRVGQPEDIAEAVSFFLGERAGYISGQVLDVAGGPQR
ncbi:SDR family oxidoreductase [Micromonospora profundi]|uniref:SDR family oxidoreductase n=1 Tax=Micromonospora profundi TaxID=1420889 RepID=A0AAJ6HR51_9ACTN|nr:SDR family oxidoreductase [Micromonospora profundi]WLS43503.1 SDR family oxidoreductase [Micromonospora profundi]